MPPFELNADEYKRENIEVKLAEVGEASYHLLDQHLEIANDEETVKHVFDTYLNGFFEEYERLNKVSGEMDPENLVVKVISYNKEDLLQFIKSVQDIEDLVEGARKALSDAEYKKYSEKLSDIIVKTNKNLKSLEDDGDNEQIAA